MRSRSIEPAQTSSDERDLPADLRSSGVPEPESVRVAGIDPVGRTRLLRPALLTCAIPAFAGMTSECGDAMDTPQLKAHCGRLAGAVSVTYGPPSNILVYSIGGKWFAYFKLSEPEKWRFSVRVSANRFVELTDVPGIKPARYRGRFHWITIVDVRTVPEDYLTELVAWSRDKALRSLSKVQQARALAR
jgi:predicted DNA-binding protein (MmcQ/YjbR family)